MAQWHGISRRKSTGGRRVPARSKRATEISSEKQFALIGEPKRKIYRTTGGNTLVQFSQTIAAQSMVKTANPQSQQLPQF